MIFSHKLIHIDIVTPHNARSFFERVAKADHKIDHLCLELVHWGFEPALTWTRNIFALCRRNQNRRTPAISIHSYEELEEDKIEEIRRSGALWMVREGADHSKDCATIIYELFSCKIEIPEKPIRRYPDDCFDIEFWDKLDASERLPKSDNYQDLSDEEFDALLRNTAKEMK